MNVDKPRKQGCKELGNGVVVTTTGSTQPPQKDQSLLALVENKNCTSI